MADEELLTILVMGSKTWNRWRNGGGQSKRIDLRGANLKDAKLQAANLQAANLEGANLFSADLFCAKLQGANLRMAYLQGANLFNANLTDADLYGANLRGANLRAANLQRANIYGADLYGANLCGANFQNTQLSMANLSHAAFGDAQFDHSCMGTTTIGDADLSRVVGLETVNHAYPSTIGIDTIYQSKGRISDAFLRSAGVPDEIIALAGHIRTGPPLQFYSCFISYSHRDEEFARKLFSRLQANKVRVWFAPEEMKGGRKLHEQIDEAIRTYDKLILVLSDHSILSEWVETEVKHAHRREKRENRRMLFPIRLTDYLTLTEWKCYDGGKDLGDEVREYFIPDFSNWKKEAAFGKALARLLADLKDSV
ncbi:MAG TPA: toll/interleukin-1 receptor domain-containing protein [Candidatus Limnocylindria bacterium]|jgi:hypothetical protein|nr:toll/interleukin-1 receptor domain-containing protein [Candidatus Limnocylindria bacterium]